MQCLSHCVFPAGCWGWVPALFPLHHPIPPHPLPRHSPAGGQWDADTRLVSTAGGPGFAGGGWSRSPAHVPLHLRHLQSCVPAGLSEGGRGRVDSSTHSQGRPGRRCVTLHQPPCHPVPMPPDLSSSPVPPDLSLAPATGSCFALCPPVAITATQDVV